MSNKWGAGQIFLWRGLYYINVFMLLFIYNDYRKLQFDFDINYK